MFGILSRIRDFASWDSLAVSFIIYCVWTTHRFWYFCKRIKSCLSIHVVFERTALSLFLVTKCLPNSLVWLFVIIPVSHCLSHFFIIAWNCVLDYWNSWLGGLGFLWCIERPVLINSGKFCWLQWRTRLVSRIYFNWEILAWTCLICGWYSFVSGSIK